MARRDDDDAPWLAEGVREERSTLVPRARLVGGGLLALALAVLVALGVYLVAGTKTDGAKGYARPEDAPLIAADAGPYKVAPADPGGAQVGGVSDGLAAAGQGDDAGSAIDVTDTEEPLARPGTTPTDLLPATIPPAPVAPVAITRPVPPPVRPAPAVAPPVPDARTPAVKPARAEPPAKSDVEKSTRPAAKPAPTDAAAPSKPHDAAAPSKPHDAARPVDLLPPAADPLAEVPVKKAKARPDAPGRVATESDALTPAKGRATLQLGAFSSPDKAEAAWAKAGGDGALSGLAKRIEPVEHDGRTLYRLRAGGVAPDAAAALCARLKAAGAACIVAP